MIARWIPALALSAIAAVPAVAYAGCFSPAQAAPAFSVEAGASNDTLSGNRPAWHEAYIEADDHADSKRSVYVRAARDERFDLSDNIYEAGAYMPVLGNVEANAFASFSPQHLQAPQNAVGAGLDIRSGGGYGVQAGYTDRNYTFERASIVNAGADRYYGRDRVALILSFATLSNAPGTAMSETVQFGRYLACDTIAASASFGRDVENTGVPGAVAVYATRSYDINDVHWFTNRLGINAGVGWALLTGAYGRMEVRFAIRERL